MPLAQDEEMKDQGGGAEDQGVAGGRPVMLVDPLPDLSKLVPQTCFL